jgi:hypothetical protein
VTRGEADEACVGADTEEETDEVGVLVMMDGCVVLVAGAEVEDEGEEARGCETDDGEEDEEARPPESEDEAADEMKEGSELGDGPLRRRAVDDAGDADADGDWGCGASLYA